MLLRYVIAMGSRWTESADTAVRLAAAVRGAQARRHEGRDVSALAGEQPSARPRTVPRGQDSRQRTRTRNGCRAAGATMAIDRWCGGRQRRVETRGTPSKTSAADGLRGSRHHKRPSELPIPREKGSPWRAQGTPFSSTPRYSRRRASTSRRPRLPHSRSRSRRAPSASFLPTSRFWK